MNNSDVLRRLRYTFDFSDQQVIDLFELGGTKVTRELISNLMKKEEDPSYEACSDVQLATFLNGLITHKRGPREGSSGPLPTESRLNNNDILRKLKIALTLQEKDMLELMALAEMPLSRAELSAFFRKPNHRHYRVCQDQLLRNFLQGLTYKYRDGKTLPEAMFEPDRPEVADKADGEATAEAQAALKPPAFDAMEGFTPTGTQLRAFQSDGIVAPSAPQTGAFAPILAGKHVVVDSGTGTGKTLAYLLPLLQRLQQDPTSRVVCLSPAAELAVQSLGVANRYKSEELQCTSLVSGGNQKKQKDRLSKATRLIMGTSGRVLELIREKKLKGVTTYVLDEPEPILSSKEGAFLLEVLSRPPRPQVVMVGATFGRNSEQLIARLLEEGGVQVKSDENPLLGKISHYRLKVRDVGDRDLQLLRFLEQENADRAIVYVNQAHLIRHVYRNLEEAGIAVVTLSSDRSKHQCQQALREFSRGEVQVLLTTDRAATGIDVRGVPWVVHFEPPRSPQGYVHRAGRTGRAGLTGKSLALISDPELFILRGLEKELGISFEPFKV